MQQPTKILNNIVLSEFIEIALGPTAPFISIPLSIATQISSIDKDEQYCHIEFPGHDNMYERPHLWRIADWKTSYKRDTQKRQLNQLDRQIYVVSTELRLKLTKMLMTKLSSDDAILCESMAKKILSHRAVDGAKFFGIDIAELVEADQAAQTYKQSIGQK